jgi:iron complex outermembrane receptor protein
MPTATPICLPLAALLLSIAAAASDADPGSSPNNVLDEVIVTAQRRSQDVQDVGVAIDTTSGKELEALRIQQPLNFSMIAPSLSTMNSTTDSTPLFLIRGIGLDDFNTNNSSGVGTYLDDVFASLPGFLTQALYDVDRVEILEGPQGTLYGKNTAGGAINIISKRPTDDFEGYVDIDYSRWDTTDVTAALSGPLSDTVKARIAGTATLQGVGYQTDIDTGEKYGKLNRGGARALFDIRLSDAADLLLNFHYVYDHSIPASQSTPNVEALIPPQPFPTAGLLDSPPGGQRVRVGGLQLYKNENGEGTSANLNVRFDGLVLTSISAFDDFSDLSLLPGGFIDWITGAEYSQNWYHCRDSLDWTFVYGLADSITQGGKAITATNFIQTQESEGLYAHAETHFSRQWTLVTGVRYSRDEVSFDGKTIDPTGLLTYASNNFTGPIIPNTVLAALDESRWNQNVSYRVEPDYHLTDKVMLYASVATAYKAGIFYGQPAQVQVDWGYVQPEHVRTAELGIKSRFFHDSLQFDAAAFDTDIRNRQSSLSLWAGPVGTQPLIAGLGNVPRSRIDGVESTIESRPIPALDIRIGATYLHARVTETLTNDNGLALFTPVSVGHMLPDAPALSATWMARYELPVSASLAMYAQANDHYVSAEHPYLGDPTTFGRGHNLGARLGVKNPVQHWDTSLWVTNLTNARPLTYAFAGSEGQQVSFYQKPRDVGVNVTYAF